MRSLADEVSSSSLAVDVKCEIWANDPNERALLIALLETAFAPVEEMSTPGPTRILRAVMPVSR